MRQKLNLYNLINSLNKTEKSYFRKFANRHKTGGKNIYLRLFDEILKIKNPENYNESSIREKMKKFSRIGNFSVLKSYLYEMILAGMRAYNSGNNIDAVIRNDIEDSRYLFKKNIYAEGFVKLNKAKKTAKLYERFEKLYEIINTERLHVKKSEPSNTEKLEQLNKELTGILEKIKNRAEYAYLNDITVSNSHKYGTTDSAELKKMHHKILGSDILKDEDCAKTFYSRIYFNQIHSHYYFIQCQYDKALSIYRKMIYIFEDSPYLLKENTRNYLLIIQNCIDMCYILNKNDEYNYYYNKFTGILNDKSFKLPENQRLYILSRSYIFELRKFTNAGDFDEKKHEIISIKNNFEEKISSFPPEERIILIYQFVTYYFGCSNFNESLKWLNMIINKEEELRRDLRLECRLLFLILHYELGNFDLLEYAVKSTYRYLRKRKTLMGIEPLILFFIRKIGSVSGKVEVRRLFAELKHRMLPYEETLKSFGFNYLAWVESKISGIRFSETVKNIYRANKGIFEVEEI